MLRSAIIISAAVSAIALGAPASAATIAFSDFSTGTDGWNVGDLSFVSPTSSPDYDSAGGLISTDDKYGSNAFVAPSAYLGDKSVAFGGTISFDLSERTTDGVKYTPLSLISGNTVLYAMPASPPSTGLTHYSIGLTGANFYIGAPFDSNGGAAVSDAQLLAVLSSLDRIGILADWQSGADFAQLDNVVLASASESAVPEPASWAMMIGGIGLVGGIGRRSRRPADTDSIFANG